MVIETERLILREYVTEDFDALFEIVSDKETIFILHVLLSGLGSLLGSSRKNNKRHPG